MSMLIINTDLDEMILIHVFDKKEFSMFLLCVARASAADWGPSVPACTAVHRSTTVQPYSRVYSCTARAGMKPSEITCRPATLHSPTDVSIILWTGWIQLPAAARHAGFAKAWKLYSIKICAAHWYLWQGCAGQWTWLFCLGLCVLERAVLGIKW